MSWEVNTATIVMMTRLEERPRVKCVSIARICLILMFYVQEYDISSIILFFGRINTGHREGQKRMETLLSRSGKSKNWPLIVFAVS